MLLQFTTGRIVTNCEQVLLQISMGTLLQPSLLQFTGGVLQIISLD